MATYRINVSKDGGTITAATYDSCITALTMDTAADPQHIVTNTAATSGNFVITCDSNVHTNPRECTYTLYYNHSGGMCEHDIHIVQEAAPAPVMPKATLTLLNGTTVTVPCDGDSTLKSSDMTSVADVSQVVSVHVENCVTKIGNYSFIPSLFTNLTSITMANSVTEIGVSIHGDSYNSTKLKSITFSSNLISIGESAFWGCSKLTNINLPNGLQTIDNDSFRNCSGLTTVVLPDSVKSIGDQCFYNCKNITTFTFGTGFTGVTSFGQSLQGTDALTKVTCKAITPPKIDSFMFCSGPITQQCHDKFRIYVPRNSVSAYEHANGWSRYYIDDEGF